MTRETGWMPWKAERGAMAPFTRHGRTLVILVTAFFAGCFADIIVEEGERPPIEEDPDINPLEPACDVGAVRCNGQWLEVCVAGAAAMPPQWTKVEDCLSQALCQEDQGSCLEAVCRAAEPHCTGAVPDSCNGSLTGYDPLGECISAAHCSPNAEDCTSEGKIAPCCLEAPCDPGELRCNEGELQRCRADQTDLDVVARCATRELCEASMPGCEAGATECTCEPPACDAGATRCTGEVLERCNAGRTGWEPVQTCTTAELCELGRTRVPLSCEPPRCEPGEFNCNEASLERCNAGQTGFDLITTCVGGPGFCNEALGACSQCSVGDTRCEGAQIEACRADRSGFDPVAGMVCATPQLCGLDANNLAVCTPPACPALDFECSGAQLVRCNEGRTAYEPFGQPCARADLCSADRQRCDFCVPNRRECTPDRTASRTCAATGNLFGPLTPCPLGCIPETGACRTCTIGQYTCAGGLLSECIDGFSFTPLNRGADCSGTNRVTCAGNVVVTSPCTFDCNTTRNACNECSATAPGSCAAGLTCNAAGLCRCAPSAFTCNGDSLLLCNAGGTAAGAGPRCSGGADQSVLRTCDDGVLSEDVCASGAQCLAAVGPECPVCTSGELACAAGALVACNAAGTAFEPEPACSGAVLRSCTGTQLVSSECGSAALCLASAGAVCAVCLPTDPPACNDAGLEITCVGGQRALRECPGNQVCTAGEGCAPPRPAPSAG